MVNYCLSWAPRLDVAMRLTEDDTDDGGKAIPKADY